MMPLSTKIIAAITGRQQGINAQGPFAIAIHKRTHVAYKTISAKIYA
jgi:hypothetical protein